MTVVAGIFKIAATLRASASADADGRRRAPREAYPARGLGDAVPKALE